MARVTVESAVRIAITVGLGLIGGAAGFTHTHNAADAAGQHGWLAWADAVVIECIALVAGLKIRADRGRSPFAVGVLVVAFVAQMASQVSQAPHTLAGWLFAAAPALGFLIVVKLTLHSSDRSGPAEQARPEPEQEQLEVHPARVTRLDDPKPPAIESAPIPEQQQPARPPVSVGWPSR